MAAFSLLAAACPVARLLGEKLPGENRNSLQRLFQLKGWQVRKQRRDARPRVEAVSWVAPPCTLVSSDGLQRLTLIEKTGQTGQRQGQRHDQCTYPGGIHQRHAFDNNTPQK